MPRVERRHALKLTQSVQRPVEVARSGRSTFTSCELAAFLHAPSAGRFPWDPCPLHTSELTAASRKIERLLRIGYRLCSWRGLARLESTVRYLGIEVDDALEMAEQKTEVPATVEPVGNRSLSDHQ
ncbi:hypothetical protein GNZ12_19780 [Paraburkholderia sp. 1N]|uniref:Uncharacterized protein n=1 Tax=Paraburkholderia solitsugae TaxID=2675748 RepID=A0ABX2BRY9_9BURK|nr:hypothetical protein [Paraburkholderia solitsugae]